MPWIPEEEIKRAREITAIEYLKKYQPNRLKKSSARNEWELTDHDSFKINELTSQWHWKSRDIGGTSALNFLIHVDGCSFLEAVQMLKDEYPTYIPPPVETKPRKPFVLPPASPDCRRVFRYLKERGISGEVLQRCEECFQYSGKNAEKGHCARRDGGAGGGYRGHPHHLPVR